MTSIHMINPENIIQTIIDTAEHTPDFAMLKKGPHDQFLVFIYGKMMRDHNLHHIVRGADYYGKAVTHNSNFLMKKTGYGSAPFVLELNNNRVHGRPVPGSMLGKVEGELYGVPLRCLTKIDCMEQNGEQMKRHRRWVQLINPIQAKSRVCCYMYLGDQEYWEEAFHNIEAMPGCASVNDEKFGKRFYYI